MDMSAIVDFFTRIPTDWIILFAIAAFGALDTLRSGAARVCAAALAFPVTAFVAPLVTKTAFIAPFATQLPAQWGGAGIFILVFIVMFVFIRRMCGVWSMNTSGAIQALLSGIALAIIVACVWVGTEALEGVVWHFGTQVQHLFGETWSLWWMLGAYAALAFARE